MGLAVRDGFGIRGELSLVLRDEASGRIVARRRAGNLIVTSGLNSLATALNWAFIQNYNTGWGSPFSSASGNLGDVYGAVGTGTSTPIAAQTGLDSEVGRALLTTGTNTSNVLTYQFFFGTTAANGTISEAGVFTSASSLQTTLTSGLSQSQAYTSLTVAALPAAIPNGSTLTINYGGAQVSGVTQQVVTTAPASLGATTISVSSFAASASFPSGTIVAYNTGTLLDRALISPTVTKTAAQTATLNLSLTLQSG
jgi:hypothetical protein